MRMVVRIYLVYRFFFMLLFPSRVTDQVICRRDYSCITSGECIARHGPQISTAILFPCSKKTKICCPPLEETTTQKMIPTLQTIPTIQTIQPIQTLQNEDFTLHPNLRLLPGMDKCGPKFYGDRITEGKNASLGEFPWMALLGNKDKHGRITWSCGGTLINDRYVLTAAHCFDGKSDVVNVIRLGEYDLKNETDCHLKNCLDPPQDIDVEEIIKHEQYNVHNVKNDIALIRLEQDVTLSEGSVLPICLPLNRNELNITHGVEYTVSGWGITDWDSAVIHDVLQKTQMEHSDMEHCNMCRQQTEERYCPITDNQICVQGFKQKDVCKGDSGGPLMYDGFYESEPKVFQIGITSFKTGVCGAENIPSIFTNVERYIPWILNHIRD